MSQKEKKALGPKKVPVGTHIFKMTGAVVKPGSSNPDSEILHLTFNKVLENGDVDVAFKPMREFIGVQHPSENYMNMSGKKADTLLKKLGVKEGLAQFNGDISIIATKEFKKEFGQEEFEADVYQNDEEESFTNPAGKVIKFKRNFIDLIED